MTKYATIGDAATAWRAQPYEHFGVCSRCRFDQGETGHPLIVRRSSRGLGSAWLCLSCFARLHVRRAARVREKVS